MHTLEQMMEFILKNRCNNKMTEAFPNSRPVDIMYALVEAMKQDTYVYAENSKGSIVGVVYGALEPENNIWFLQNIIATEKWVLPEFIRILFKKWPNYSVKIFRKNRTRILTLKQLERILIKL